MEPIKLEDDLREKLQERELFPSNKAWETLAKNLESESPKPKNKNLWYAIAACFIGMLIIGSNILFDNNIPDQDDAIFVEKKVILPETDIIKNPINSSKENEVNIASEEKLNIKKVEPSNLEEVAIETPNELIVSSKEKPLVNIQTKPSIIDKEETILVAKTDLQEKVNNRVERFIEPKIESISITDLKVNEIVDRLKEMKINNDSITDTEINALLAQALEEIKIQKILKNNKIDAASLLMDVELELETSFRDKVFNALGDSYNVIRTAVSNRNN